MFAFDEELRVVEWNTAAERLTGIRAGEAIGTRCWEVFRGRDPFGGVVCHKGCSRARLIREGWPVGSQRLDVDTPKGFQCLVVETIAARNGGSPVFLHLLRTHTTDDEPASSDPPPALTPRQREVLTLLGEGRPARQIAHTLVISETTVRNHIRAILRELGAHSQLEAVAKARLLGIV